MKRRQILNSSGWIAASAIFGPGLLSALQGCATDSAISSELLVFSPTQFELTKAIADTILPRTQSPSASEVKVPEFMDLLLQDVLSREAKEHLLEGLSQFNIDCEAATGKSFPELATNERYDYLEPIDHEVMGADYRGKIPFYYTFKKLCISIYYSTEEGIKQNLKYRPIPGSYQGDIPLSADRIIEVGNEM